MQAWAGLVNTHASSTWWWIIGLVVLGFLVWWMTASTSRDRRPVGRPNEDARKVPPDEHHDEPE